MLNNNENLIHIVAKALVESPVRECFLVVDDMIEMAPQLPGVRAEIMRVVKYPPLSALAL